MNKDESMYFNMYVQVQRYLDGAPDKWSGVPAIVRYKNNLDSNLTAIKVKDVQSAGTTTGTTVSKSELKNQLSVKAVILCGAMYAYGSEVGDLQLMSQTDYSTSALFKMSDTDFAQTVKGITDLATGLTEALADQGVTSDQVTEVTTSLDDFYEMIGLPRSLSITYSTAGTEVDVLMEQTLNLLNDQLDKAMLRYRLTDVAFYEGYDRSRVLVG